MMQFYSSDDDYHLYYQFAENILSILLLSMSIGWLPMPINLNSRMFTGLFWKNEEMDKLEKINSQIHEVLGQMNGLSPSADFAKYFKLERKLKELKEEKRQIDKAFATRPNSFKMRAFIKLFLLLLSLLLAWHSKGGFICLSMDSKWLYPVNIFTPMQFLSLMGFDMERGSQMKGMKQHHLTFFDVVICTIIAKKVYNYRQNAVQRTSNS